ncbi:hypothetical protein CDAR_93371 [Caerostris darwini]|uniref:Uncharacterized protein n=1 Tax=Caerostris darwini TaxID=1538125 RepID=A0AAV4QHA0_9ARAC|nr:hypothetical protein CDAR_93371 [Caerostris darwini]
MADQNKLTTSEKYFEESKIPVKINKSPLTALKKVFKVSKTPVKINENDVSPPKKSNINKTKDKTSMSLTKKSPNISNTAQMRKTNKYYYTSNEKFSESSISIKIDKDSKETKKLIDTLNKSLVIENNIKSTKFLSKPLSSPAIKKLKRNEINARPELKIESPKIIKKGTNDKKNLGSSPYSSHKIQYRSEMKEKPIQNSKDSSVGIRTKPHTDSRKITSTTDSHHLVSNSRKKQNMKISRNDQQYFPSSTNSKEDFISRARAYRQNNCKTSPVSTCNQSINDYDKSCTTRIPRKDSPKNLKKECLKADHSFLKTEKEQMISSIHHEHKLNNDQTIAFANIPSRESNLLKGKRPTGNEIPIASKTTTKSIINTREISPMFKMGPTKTSPAPPKALRISSFMTLSSDSYG